MEDSQASKSDMWMKVAATIFGLWAGIVAYAANEVTSSLKALNENQIKARSRYDDFLVTNERRITQIEERQNKVLEAIARNQEALQKHEQRIDRLELDGTRQSAQRILRERAAP